jgi:A/G-specific adenine glycosylase
LLDEPELWAALPGVGRYILGAVLSQAFDRRLPIVEVNSIRVLCRLFGQEADPKNTSVRQWLWQTAKKVLPRRRVGEFNQALMELGALVCTPTAPKCSACPVARHCSARKHNLQHEIPVRSSRPAVIRRQEVAVVPWKAGRVFLLRRPAHGRWASLWEFPHGEQKKGEDAALAAKRVLNELTGLVAAATEHVVTLHHTIMRYRITLDCFEAARCSGQFRSPSYVEGQWVRPTQLSRYAVSSPQRRLARAIASGPRQRQLF